MAKSDCSHDLYYDRLSLGQRGHVVLDSLSVIDPLTKFVAVEGWNDNATLTYNIATSPVDGSTTPVTLSIADGRIVYGRITNLVVSSGTILAYYM